MENRKAYLRRIESIYKETKFWILSLSNASDKEFFVSKGYNGFELYIILFIVMPMVFVIETGFNGVPLLVSFLKRRLKRKGARKGDRKGENHHMKKKVSVIYKPVKCCNSCGIAKVKKAQKEAVKKAESKPGKSGNSRRNFLKRLKKRVEKKVHEEKLVDEFQEPSCAIDDLLSVAPEKPASKRQKK